MIEIENISIVSFDTEFHKNGSIIDLHEVFQKLKFL